MRELKFRAWHKIFGKMEYGIETASDINSTKTIYPNFGCYIEAERDGEGVFVEQFTGLTDKNGKEIYEGDIIRDSEDQSNIGEVGFELGSFYCTCSMGTDFYKWAYRNGEVIGNVHENSNLVDKFSVEKKD